MSNNKSDGLLGGMIIGAALGAIAGILAAPRTGKETRHILKKSADALPELAEDLATSIQFHADRLGQIADDAGFLGVAARFGFGRADAAKGFDIDLHPVRPGRRLAGGGVDQGQFKRDGMHAAGGHPRLLGQGVEDVFDPDDRYALGVDVADGVHEGLAFRIREAAGDLVE